MARPASAESSQSITEDPDCHEVIAGEVAGDLLAWYDRHARRLPWRVPPGAAGAVGADPYRVWLSEVMLQQTTVAAVAPYYQAFLERWPTVDALAAAPLDAVLTAWAGLGYYARARNLHKCAAVVSGERSGRFPESEAALRALPGIGPYTAAAIAAIGSTTGHVLLPPKAHTAIATVTGLHINFGFIYKSHNSSTLGGPCPTVYNIIR